MQFQIVVALLFWQKALPLHSSIFLLPCYFITKVWKLAEKLLLALSHFLPRTAHTLDSLGNGKPKYPLKEGKKEKK